MTKRDAVTVPFRQRLVAGQPQIWGGRVLIGIGPMAAQNGGPAL
jgi:hypothetical protein